MDFLTLCNEVRREAGVSGDGPSTVVGQTDMYAKIVSWVNQSWMDIQIMRPNWLFMSSEFSFDTIVAQRDYTAIGAGITDLKLWETGSFLIYEKTAGENDQNDLPYHRYLRWRAEFRNRMNARINERPMLFTVKPDNSIRFEPRPDKIYTIDGDYKRSTQEFSANDDIPTGLPNDFHQMIVWKALMYYADDQNAPDALNKAVEAYGPLLFRLENEQLQEFDTDFRALA